MKQDTDPLDDDNAVYSITPYGLLHLYLGEAKAQTVLEQFELHMRRNNVGMAIVPGETKPQFVPIARREKQP